jgi:hypothetical protein
MSMRVHTSRAGVVALSVLSGDELVGVYGDGFAGQGQALVVEDTGNCEALVLLGDDDELVQLAEDIGRVVRSRAAPS